MRCLELLQHFTYPAGLDVPEDAVVNLDHRSQRTTAKTGNPFHRIGPIGCGGGVVGYVQLTPECIVDDIRPLDMTGCTTTHTDGVASIGHHAELTIESGYRYGLGTVDVGCLVYPFQRIGGQIAPLALQGLKQGDDMLSPPPHPIDERVRPLSDGLARLVGR